MITRTLAYSHLEKLPHFSTFKGTLKARYCVQIILQLRFPFPKKVGIESALLHRGTFRTGRTVPYR
jgi:hypothetical protein